jgi:predicted lipid-binding transport protein (Tim44 family)
MLGVAAVLLGAALVAADVEAKRTGGGRTVGAQRSITHTPPAAAPAKPAQQAQQAAPARQAAPAQPAAGAPAAPQPASGLARWAPMLGGLALGGLLGALIGGSGLGAMLLGWLAIALLAFGVFAVVRMLMHKRAAEPARPLQYAGLGSETVAAPPPSQASGFEPRAAPMRRQASANVPSGFDTAGFLRAAKLNFMKLQIANDRSNLDELREFTTAELFEELQKDVLERAGAAQQTDVVSLSADLLEVVTEGDEHWASVRFTGMIREDPGAAPEGFEEVWNLVKPTDGSAGWLLAGIQQMH